MSKNKTINQLLSNLVLAGLLIGSLPVGLPLNGQSQGTSELKKLRQEVDREVVKIKRTVDRLKAAKIAIPALVVGVGLLTTAVIALLFVVPSLKLRIAITLLKKRTFESYDDMLKKIKRLVPRRIFEKMENKKMRPDVFLEIQPIAKLNRIKSTLLPELKKLNFLGSIGAISAFLFGLVGTTMFSIGSFFGLSAWSISAAIKGAKKIDQIKKEHPGILTPQQERVLTKFKKLSKDVVIQGIIKNLRLENVQMTVVNAVMLKHPELIKKPKKARKVFVRYIKLRWQEEIFEKALAAGAVTLSTTTFQLKKVKKKIKKLEKSYPGLRTALENAVQTYTTQVNMILEELKQEIMKSAEKKAKEIKVPLHPVVPL